jgi:hypothetical protein
MTFNIKGVNYVVNSDGSNFTISKEGGETMFTYPVDQTLSAEDAMTKVLAEANTFLVSAFPGFVSEFMALFAKLVVSVNAGIPTISLGA